MLAVDEVREVALRATNAPVASPVERHAEVGSAARERVGREGRQREPLLREQPFLAHVERAAPGRRLRGRRRREAAHGECRGETGAARVHR